MFCLKCGKVLPEDIDYCPQCGQRVTGAKTFAAERPGVITAAAIICGALGVLILFSSAGFLTKTAIELHGLPLSLALLVSLGVIVLIFGVLYLIAGTLLWKSKRRGGIIGIALGALGIILSVMTLSGLSYFIMLPGIVVIILIVVGWSKLR